MGGSSILPSGSDLVLFVDLPIPPSVNSIWHRKGRKVYRSKAYTLWLKAADEAAIAQGKLIGSPWKGGPVQISMTVFRGKGWRKGRDLDNCAKVVIDWLRSRGHLVDDSWEFVSSVTVRMDYGEPGQLAFVEVVARADGHQWGDR